MSGPHPALLAAALILRRLRPQVVLRNPVVSAAEIAAILATLLLFGHFVTGQVTGSSFIGHASGWLWLTIYCASFIEVIAEGRRITRTRSLRTSQVQDDVKILRTDTSGAVDQVSADALRPGDVVLVETGDMIPADGEAVEGVAEVDESAVTGESAPVIRESHGERSTVIGGTRVISDWLKVRVTAKPGDSFLDHISSIVDDTRQLQSSGEGRASIVLALFALASAACIVLAMPVIAVDDWDYAGITVALFAALLPLASATGAVVARLGGIVRLLAANIVAKSSKAVEAAGRIETILLDKTGTITVGHRQALEFLPLPGVRQADLARAALLASRADETSEGQSILALAEKVLGKASLDERVATPIPFSARSRMSGARLVDGSELWKGATDAVLEKIGLEESEDIRTWTQHVAGAGGTPLLVAGNGSPLGVIRLDDVAKPGLRNRFAQLRRMGIRTIMITGDNPLTAATVAAEVGVDDYVAQASPAAKLEVIRSEQAKGRITAMCGDGFNDAPALRQADVGLAMGIGEAAARQAGNMIDLDNDPLKLMEVVRIGRWITRRRKAFAAITLANDVGKFVVVVPALLAGVYPQLTLIQPLAAASPHSIILSTIIFNGLVVVAALPVAVSRTAATPRARKDWSAPAMVLFGLAGFAAPLLGIPLIQRIITVLGVG
jgi:K+-transporting ATPase ATPase B chain